MSVQKAALQLLQVEKSQDKLESQIAQFQTVLSKLQGEHWGLYFTKQLTAIKQQVAVMEDVLNKRTKQNECLKQERDSAQKTVQDLTIKLRETQLQKPKVMGGTMKKEIDDNIKSIAACIKDTVINKAQSERKTDSFDEFTPIEAQSQVVAGINWFLKIRTAKDTFIHIKVWAKLNKEYELSAVQWNKTKSDLLDAF